MGATRQVNHPKRPIARVAEVFCGAGGLATGFRNEGFEVTVGFDLDPACRHAFEHNTGAEFLMRDADGLCADQVSERLRGDLPRVLVGCAPCQPFSSYSKKFDDGRWSLLDRFADLITKVEPEVASMENVPALANFRGGEVLSSFVCKLADAGYEVVWKTIRCTDLGIAQTRSRLVLIASRIGKPALPEKTRTGDPASLRSKIADLPPVAAGEEAGEDPMHRAPNLSALNLERIRSSKPGGSWSDWPERMRLRCHRKASGATFKNVYGRMMWDKPAPTITTQFYKIGTGRFGHPEQDRAITFREAARIQSFPDDFEFVAPGEPIRASTVGRLIGNAVPVDLGRAIARTIAKHLTEGTA